MKEADKKGKTIVDLRVGKLKLLRIELSGKGDALEKKSFSQYCYEYYGITGLTMLVYEIVPPDYIIRGNHLLASLGIIAFCISVIAIIIGYKLLFSKTLKVKRDLFFTTVTAFTFCANIFHVGTTIILWIYLAVR